MMLHLAQRGTQNISSFFGVSMGMVPTLLCLGVTNELPEIRLHTPITNRHYLRPLNVENVGKRIHVCCESKLCEFQWSCPYVDRVNRSNVTEFRTYSLYIRPVCLKGLLLEDVYTQFMLYV